MADQPIHIVLAVESKTATKVTIEPWGWVFPLGEGQRYRCVLIGNASLPKQPSWHVINDGEWLEVWADWPSTPGFIEVWTPTGWRRDIELSAPPGPPPGFK